MSIIKVMPSGTDVDMKKVDADIRKLTATIPHLKLNAITEKPVAFGIKCLEVSVIKPDSSGGTDELEEKMMTIPGVENVEVTGVTLI